MGTVGALVEDKATAGQLATQGGDQLGQRGWAYRNPAPEDAGPGEGSDLVQHQLEGGNPQPAGGGLGAPSLLGGRRTEKYQGEVNVKGAALETVH